MNGTTTIDATLDPYSAEADRHTYGWRSLNVSTWGKRLIRLHVGRLTLDVYRARSGWVACKYGGANGTARYWNLYTPLGLVTWVTRKANTGGEPWRTCRWLKRLFGQESNERTTMKNMWKKIKRLLGFGKKHFVWFDVVRHISIEIDRNVTGPDGKPYPPIDCVMAVVGNLVEVYESRHRGTLHVCVAGRNVGRAGCSEDFDSDNYRLVKTLRVTKPNAKR
jgi:hypothetical protein